MVAAAVHVLSLFGRPEDLDFFQNFRKFQSIHLTSRANCSFTYLRRLNMGSYSDLPDLPSLQIIAGALISSHLSKLKMGSIRFCLPGMGKQSIPEASILLENVECILTRISLKDWITLLVHLLKQVARSAGRRQCRG